MEPSPQRQRIQLILIYLKHAQPEFPTMEQHTSDNLFRLELTSTPITDTTFTKHTTISSSTAYTTSLFDLLLLISHLQFFPGRRSRLFRLFFTHCRCTGRECNPSSAPGTLPLPGPLKHELLPRQRLGLDYGTRAPPKAVYTTLRQLLCAAMHSQSV